MFGIALLCRLLAAMAFDRWSRLGRKHSDLEVERTYLRKPRSREIEKLYGSIKSIINRFLS